MIVSSPKLHAFDPGIPVLVGYSGGLDSSVLLHRLATLSTSNGTPLRAVHIHHGLASNADAWARQCQSFCDSLGVAMTLVRVEVSRVTGLGPEASAREARYRAFESILGAGERLALAHHRDDQAETVLLRLLRASGSDGLAAMRPLRPFAKGQLWRPLLEVPRSELLDYAHRHGLAWIEDPSNSDPDLDRNFLRHRILPALSERWPQAGAALARSAVLLDEDADLLRAEADRRLAQLQSVDGSTLSVIALLDFEPAWRSRILRRWLSTLSLPSLPGKAFGIIESELLRSRPDAEPEYHWAGCTMRRWRDLLHVENRRECFPDGWQSEWNGESDLLLPTGDLLRWISIAEPCSPESETTTSAIPENCTSITPPLSTDGIPASFSVRARHGGERMRLPGRKHSQALKKLLQEAGIPPWERERLPLLLADDGELLAAGDLLLSARMSEHCRARSLRLHWQRS